MGRPDDDLSPIEWDGTTRYSRTIRRYEYESRCMHCGRASTMALTDIEYLTLRPRYCEVCGGRCFVLRADYDSTAATHANRKPEQERVR